MSTPTIKQDQIEYKKKVGRIGQAPVWEVGLIGGLRLIAKMGSDGRSEILGAGPHRAVARHIAKKRNSELEYTEIAKSDHVETAYFSDILPAFEELTDKLRNHGNK